jgi:hypothetical protein
VKAARGDHGIDGVHGSGPVVLMSGTISCVFGVAKRRGVRQASDALDHGSVKAGRGDHGIRGVHGSGPKVLMSGAISCVFWVAKRRGVRQTSAALDHGWLSMGVTTEYTEYTEMVRRTGGFEGQSAAHDRFRVLRVFRGATVWHWSIRGSLRRVTTEYTGDAEMTGDAEVLKGSRPDSTDSVYSVYSVVIPLWHPSLRGPLDFTVF